MKKQSTRQGSSKLKVENQNNSVYFKREDVDGTIFTTITKENKTIIVIGDQIVSDKVFNNHEEAISYIETKPWDLIFIGCSIYTEKINKIKETNGKNNKIDNQNS